MFLQQIQLVFKEVVFGSIGRYLIVQPECQEYLQM